MNRKEAHQKKKENTVVEQKLIKFFRLKNNILCLNGTDYKVLPNGMVTVVGAYSTGWKTFLASRTLKKNYLKLTMNLRESGIVNSIRHTGLPTIHTVRDDGNSKSRIPQSFHDISQAVPTTLCYDGYTILASELPIGAKRLEYVAAKDSDDKRVEARYFAGKIDMLLYHISGRLDIADMKTCAYTMDLSAAQEKKYVINYRYFLQTWFYAFVMEKLYGIEIDTLHAFVYYTRSGNMFWLSCKKESFQAWADECLELEKFRDAFVLHKKEEDDDDEEEEEEEG